MAGYSRFVRASRTIRALSCLDPGCALFAIRRFCSPARITRHGPRQDRRRRPRPCDRTRRRDLPSERGRGKRSPRSLLWPIGSTCWRKHARGRGGAGSCAPDRGRRPRRQIGRRPYPLWRDNGIFAGATSSRSGRLDLRRPRGRALTTVGGQINRVARRLAGASRAPGAAGPCPGAAGPPRPWWRRLTKGVA